MHFFQLLLLGVKLLWMIELTLCISTPKEEKAVTSWVQIPSISLYRSVIDKETGKSIRSGFRNPDEETSKDIIHQKSPSLELTLADTGDETYLDKKTIKHSLSDLSSLTKAKKILGDKILSCNAIQEGPKIYFPTCPGELVVITIAGSMKMTCNEIERRVFYGPVTIKTVSCQQSFVFDMGCGKKLALSINDPTCTDSKYNILLLIISILFGLSTVALLIIVLWFVGIKRGVNLNGRKTTLVRNGCYYELCYNEYIDGDGEKAYSLEGETSNVNMQSKIIRKHWVILLLTFLICRPINVVSFEMLETYDSTILKYNYKMILGDSEVVKFGSDKIQREPVVHTSSLAKMFTTAKWSLNTKEEYFCQWYKCEAVSACGMGMLPFVKVGSLAQSLFNFKNQDHSYYTCQKLQGYCMFGNGCKLLAFEVVVDESEMYTVYSIGIGGSHGGDITPPTGCIVDRITDKSSGILDSHLLLSGSNGKNYLCHRDLFSAKPEMGMLGDLQITGNGSLHFASNEIRCVADHNDRAICRYGSPFINSIKTLCDDASKTNFKLSVDVSSRIISWKLSGEAVISMKCDRKLPLKSSNSKCVNVDIKVWEVAHLDSHLLLSFKATSENEPGVFKFPSVVHMNGHSFLCNGEPQFTELYDLKSLTSVGINYTFNSIPYNSLDPIQEDHFSNSDPDTSDGVTIVKRLTDSLPFWGLGTTFIIIFGFVLILCVRR